MTGHIHQTAEVAETASLGRDTTIWHYAQIREGARVGDQCNVGRGVYVGTGVEIGDRCKIQNYALVYEPATLESGVFIGPAAVLTNDEYPRAVDVDGHLKRASDWRPTGVLCKEGASIGAKAVCVAPLVVGRWAMVAAGAVVVDDVPDFALVAGVPARRIGWVGRAGTRLEQCGEAMLRCPVTGDIYVENNGRISEGSENE